MVLNIAHRGTRSLALENALAAVRKALEIGVDMQRFITAGAAGLITDFPQTLAALLQDSQL